MAKAGRESVTVATLELHRLDSDLSLTANIFSLNIFDYIRPLLKKVVYQAS